MITSRKRRLIAIALLAIVPIVLPISLPISTSPNSYSITETAFAASVKSKLIHFSDVDALTFKSTSVTFNKKAKKLASTEPITIRFENKTVSIKAGCNTMNGAATLSKGILKVKNLASTRMACSTSLMNQDTWLAKVITANPKITKLGNQLTMTSSKNVIKFKLYETYGYADTPLGDENSEALVKATCEKLIAAKATESQAQFEAEQNALIFRVTSREGEDFAVTMDYRVNRMNVKILGGIVVECTQG